MNITEEQLRQLIDPDMPQLAREIIAREVQMHGVVEQVVEPTTPTEIKKHQMLLLYRLCRWAGCDTWAQHNCAYNIVLDKFQELEEEIAPGIVEFNACGSIRDAERRLDKYFEEV
jgi:hypothetical protein